MMILLGLLVGGILVAGPAWTYWLMLKVIRPNDGATTQLQMLNDRMLRMLGTNQEQQAEALNRLFSASSAMQSQANQLFQRALTPMAGPPAPSMVMSPRMVHDDDEDNLLLDDEEQRAALRAAADRRAELEEEGLETVPAGNI